MAAQFHYRIIVKMGGVAKQQQYFSLPSFVLVRAVALLLVRCLLVYVTNLLNGRDVEILGTAVSNKSFGGKHFCILPVHMDLISRPAYFSAFTKPCVVVPNLNLTDKCLK